MILSTSPLSRRNGYNRTFLHNFPTPGYQSHRTFAVPAEPEGPRDIISAKRQLQHILMQK
ncbi:unnamed protein product [Acanthoscelides obtectus]|uniref:Uncharacterized protein n=1 Tax=Acanthoscelides obtectus TaxID=200917 RepID=A0A9P0LDV0_ACAOB|nr:unnamed protein product [Acanthoscelides obtectus]CAK1633053.1 hypothetical protein AOBTE_LOCUS7908 [Acanthoscelides obtectus]